MKTIFISFDYDHDRQSAYLLSDLKENQGSQITFEDVTPKDILPSAVDRIKAGLTQKIKMATHALVIVGEHSNHLHDYNILIDDLNWQWWEINQSIAQGKKLIGVKIDSKFESPTPLINANTTWATSYTTAAILKAIRESSAVSGVENSKGGRVQAK